MPRPSSVPDPFSRINWRLVDEYPEVYEDDAAFALYARLLMIGDASWPASAHLPAGVRPAALKRLVEAQEHRPDGSVQPAPLILMVGSGRFRVRGMDKAREERQQAARVGATARWQRERPYSGGNAEDMRPHSEGNADAMHIPSQERRAEPTRAPAREDLKITDEEARRGLASLRSVLDSMGTTPPKGKPNGHARRAYTPTSDEESAARARAVLADPESSAALREVAMAQLARLGLEA